jgi:putative two-component system response regulator
VSQRLGTGPATILVVDDDAALRDLLAEYLASLGHTVLAAESGEAALQTLGLTAPDLIVTDVRMMGMDGIELTSRIKRDPRFQLTPIIILTALGDLDARVQGLAAGADDFFSKPFEVVELAARIAALLRLKALTDQLDRAEAVLVALGHAIEARDPHTAGKCDRLARHAPALGRALGADDALLRALRLGGALHDIGKVAIPDRILLKPDRLDPEERRLMETHAVVGADLLRGLRTLDDVRPIVRHHHERMNGSGYPDGLAGEAIPFGARIVAVLDVFDSLYTARAYRAALSREQALEVLLRETDAGSWDPRVVTAFREMLKDLTWVA